jgi:hypothetical protein
MAFKESDERKFPQLNLHDLAHLVERFLAEPNYSFVRAVYLSPGTAQRKPDPSFPPLPYRPYNLLFEVPSVPEEMAGHHKQFMENLSHAPEYSLLGLEKAYRNRENAKFDEWMWYEVVDAKNIDEEGLHYFVLPGEGVRLFPQVETSEVTEKVKIGPEPQTMEIQPPIEPRQQNVWEKIGDKWEIVFNGEPYGTFDHLIGFEYLRFYIKNSPREYTGVDIDREVNTDKKNPIDIDNLRVDLQRDGDGNLKVVGLRDGNMERTITRNAKMDLNDPEDKKWFDKLISECSGMRTEEDNAVDRDKKLAIREQREALEDYICEIKEHSLSEDEISKINDSVRKAVGRAVKELKRRGAERLVEHLEESFSPRYKNKSALLGTLSKGYKPKDPVKWDLG